MEKILEGDLSRFEVPDLLTFLNMGRRTGALVLEQPEQETKMFFREGRPVFATTTKSALRLGSMLVKTGRVSQDHLGRLLDRHRSGTFRLGQVLLSEKLVSEKELASVLKVQVSEVIFDTFEWTSGCFSFFDHVTPPATAVTLEMDLQNLIMEGVRRIDERGRLQEAFPDLDVVAEAVSNPERVKQSVTFTPEEWQVFFLVDGRRSLREICHLVGNPDETATLQILHNLMLAKFITVIAAAPSEEPPAAPPPPPPVSSAAHTAAATAARPAALPPGAEGTQKLQDGRPALPSRPLSVEFTQPPLRPLDDDTENVVNRQAIRYMDSAPQVTVSRLVLLVAGAESSFPLIRDSYTVGRHRNNDIVINDPKVSGFHARIDRSPEGFVLVDLNSRNGCHVNGRRVTSQLLQTGDEIRMGTARLTYKVDSTTHSLS